jgi:hypothetical protein
VLSRPAETIPHSFGCSHSPNLNLISMPAFIRRSIACYHGYYHYRSPPVKDRYWSNDRVYFELRELLPLVDFATGKNGDREQFTAWPTAT